MVKKDAILYCVKKSKKKKKKDYISVIGILMVLMQNYV